MNCAKTVQRISLRCPSRIRSADLRRYLYETFGSRSHFGVTHLTAPFVVPHYTDFGLIRTPQTCGIHGGFMQIQKRMFVILLAVLALGTAVVLTATDNSMAGVGLKQEITFTGPTLIGGTLVPAGDYKV